MPLIKRLVKGSPLTFQEGDNNLQYLEDLALSSSADFNNWTGSSLSQFAGTASYALTASYASNTDTGSLVTISSFNAFTSSYNTGSFTGTLIGTASWAENAQTASYVELAQTASYYNETDPIFTAKSGSLATTGSNSFVGDQTITGSLTIINNLTVLGSASVTYISESTLNIGTNLITVNTFTPSIRFGGLAVIDSGSSPLHSGSFLFDSQKDQFIFVHQSAPLTSSIFLLGPETYNDLGNEIYLTQNRIPKGSGIEHLNDSNISDDGSTVSINSNTEITGSLFVSSGSYRNLEISNANNTGSIVVRNSLYVSGAPSGSILTPSYITGSDKFPQLVIEAVNRDDLSSRFQIKAGGWHTSTWFGAGAMDSWTGVNPGVGFAGIQNDAFGFRTLGKLTTGFNNTAFGGFALGDTTTGTRNVAVGLVALFKNTIGNRNTAIGNEAGADNISGSRNIFIGDFAGRGIVSGSNNTIIGTQTGLPVGLSNNVIISVGAGTTRARSFETGNWLFQNGGTFVDNGFRLDVNGSTRFGSSNQMTVQSTGEVDIKNGLTVTGSLNAPSITGSLQGTASFATNAFSSSYAITASYALNGGGGGTSAFLRNQTNASSTDTITVNQSIFNPSNLRVLNTSIFIIESQADYYTLGNLSNSGSLIVSGTLKIGGILYNSGSIVGPGIIE